MIIVGWLQNCNRSGATPYHRGTSADRLQRGLRAGAAFHDCCPTDHGNPKVGSSWQPLAAPALRICVIGDSPLEAQDAGEKKFGFLAREAS